MMQGKTLQCFAVGIALLNMLSSGLFYAWPSPSLPRLKNEALVDMTDNEGSWIATIFFFGYPIGALLFGLIADLIGRKPLILINAALSLLSWIVIANANSPIVFLVARFIAGIGDGLAYSTIPVYIAEIVNPNFRGLSNAFLQVYSVFGSLLINVVGYYCTLTTTALTCSAVPLLLILGYSWLPETPQYYQIKGMPDKSKEVLFRLNGSEDTDFDLELKPMKEEEVEHVPAKFLELFTVARYRKVLLIVAGTVTAQQFCGFTPIVLYTQTIFLETADDFPVIVSTVIFYSCWLVSTSFSAFLVDRAGRRPLLIASITGCGLSLLIESINVYVTVTNDDYKGCSWLTLINITVFIVSFSLGLFQLPILLASELFQPEIKANAFSLILIYYCGAATVVAQLYQILDDAFGLYVPFFIFSLCCLLSLIFTIFYVPETKNKTLQEIHRELDVLS